MKPVVTTREELYKEVWETPLSVLCKKYGVSDNAVRKKCKSINIPLPTNAYWGQLRAGRNPVIPSLTPHTESRIVFNPNYSVSEPKPIKEKEVIFSYLEDERMINVARIYEALGVNKNLSNPHSLITKHNEQFQKLKKNKDVNLNNLNDCQRNYNFKTDYPIIDTSTVTESQIHRTYLILDSLFKALEKCGCEIKIKNNFDSYVKVNGFEIRFRIREKYAREDNPKKHPQYEWMYNRYVYAPSGILSFSINLSSWPEHTITETEKHRLDAKIKDIFKGFFDMAEKLKQREIEFAERDRRYAEERKKEEIIRQRNLKEKESITNLIKDAARHNQAKILREYISDKQKCETSSEELMSWIKWANDIADWIDPLIEKNHEFLKGTYEEDKEKPKYY